MSKPDADKERAEIAKLRSMGRNRFAFVFGVLCFGVPLAVALPVMFRFMYGWHFAFPAAVVYGPLCLFGGFVVGHVIWWALGKRVQILDREEARAHIAELAVEQYGFTHLWYRGWEHLRKLMTGCLVWTGVLVVISILILLRQGGWNNVVQRPDAVAVAAGAAILLRVVCEMAWHKVVINERGVRVMNGGSRKDYPNNAVQQLIATFFRADRLLLEIHWTDEDKRPTRIFGRVPDAKIILGRLSHAYRVTHQGDCD